MTRTEIKQRQKEILLQIDALKKEFNEISSKEKFICDDEKWFEEKIEEHITDKFHKKAFLYNGKLIGRQYYKDIVKGVEIIRSEIITINGEPIKKEYI